MRRWLALFAVMAISVLPVQAHPTRWHDPRAGVLDASDVVIVKQANATTYQVQEVFMGTMKPGQTFALPDFQLYEDEPYGPNRTEAITPNTRILLFLKRSPEDVYWEITDHGYCFFWVQNPANAVDLGMNDMYWGSTSAHTVNLEQMAQSAVALRRAWDRGLSLTDPRQRVAALFPFLDQGTYAGGLFFEADKVLNREDVKAYVGEYLAQNFDTLKPEVRTFFLPRLSRYPDPRLHSLLLHYLHSEQAAYESYLGTHDPSAKGLVEEWNHAPEQLKDIYVDLSYGLAGLGEFQDRRDLPYIRQLAQWAINYRFKQVDDAVLDAFRLMPDKANLPVIDAIWHEYALHQWAGDPMTADDVIRSLSMNKFPETIPLLAQFLDDKNSDVALYAQLTMRDIVGEDLGKDPQVWRQWYLLHTPADKAHGTKQEGNGAFH